MKRFEIQRQVAELHDEFDCIHTEFDYYADIDEPQARQYALNISCSFIDAATTQMLSTGTMKDFMRDIVGSERSSLQQSIERCQRRTSYNPLNAFVALRIYSRKIRQIERNARQIRRDASDLLQRYGKVCEPLRKRHTPFSARIKREIERHSQALRIMIELIDKAKLPHFMSSIRMWFSFYTMSKNDFLSLITVNHDTHYWDGPENRTMDNIAKLPDVIDEQAFQEAVFMQRIEHDRDCYLFDQYMAEFSDMLKDKEFSAKMWQGLTEIFGPIPSYSVQQDEFGNVTSVEQNKPQLTVVEGGNV